MKILYIILGSLSLILGIIGIVIPLIPTTPFLLLTAALYIRSSPQLYHWLLNRPKLGTYIRDFREEKAIPLHSKITSITLVWGTLLYGIFGMPTPLWIKILLLLIAICVSWHILSYKTKHS